MTPAQARAELERAKAALEDAERRVAELEKDVTQAREQYERVVGVSPDHEEAPRRESRDAADRQRARALYQDAGRPVPAWLR